MQDLICLDIGNTNIDIGYFKGNELRSTKKIKTCLFIKSKQPLPFPKNINCPVCFCSVVPEAEDTLRKHHCPSQLFELKYESLNNVSISYPNKNEIGADRLANFIAVDHLYQSTCIVVDVGTAVTFDVISKEKGYVGGIIAPGPQGYLDFLHQNTALLPKLSLQDKNNITEAIGQNTRDAMLLGVMKGFKPMVYGIIESIKKDLGKEFNSKSKIILVGGSSEHLISESFSHEPHLTLNGLAISYHKYLSNL